MSVHSTYDFIVIGAGSAGCVLANRLSENPQNSVLLIEFGGSDKSIFIQMPSALSIPMNTKKYNWQFESLPEPYANNRVFHCPRGKVIGGSSSINGMVYVRGHARDFDEWHQLGATDWDYSHCLPYFKKAEHWVYGENDYRGQQGPLHVNNGNGMENPLYQAFIDAGVQAGYLKTEDYNGYCQEGFGPMHMTIQGGVRCSTANAYLKPVLNRSNLTVLTHALVHQIQLAGKQAVGVTYEQSGQIKTVKANRNIILSAGPIGSPHILQRSGIGHKDDLKAAGIEMKHELPGVGRNLQDHLEFFFQFKCKQPITLNSQLSWWHKFLIGSKWILTKKGLGATNHFESCGFIRSKAGVEWPDLQYHFLPGAISYDGKNAFDGHGFQTHIGYNKPKSRGWVRAQSTEPTSKPLIQFNYLAEEADREGFRACVRLTREIMNQPAMASYMDMEISPGRHIQTNEEIDAFIRERVESAYHPCGTCKMGEDDKAVVDSNTQVRGLSGLSVVDSSIFPTVTNGNLNAPTIMVAERAADLILKKTPLTPEYVDVAIARDWQTEQRSQVAE